MRVTHVDSDEPVAIKRDDSDVEDRSCAAEHIRCDPQITHNGPKRPPGRQLTLHITQYYALQERHKSEVTYHAVISSRWL